MLKEGDAAPDFTMNADKGGAVSLQSLKGEKVVLYFYTKDDTPGCTKESCEFRDHYATFQNKGVHIFGISCDDIDSHEKFSEKFDLPFPLLSDPDASVCKAYGVYKQKSRDGKTYMGIERTTFIISVDGQIDKIYPEVDVNGHVDAVLGAV